MNKSGWEHSHIIQSPMLSERFDAVVGMNLLFEETLIELELLLFEERYSGNNYIEKEERAED